jgi:hypothetical protein
MGWAKTFTGLGAWVACERIREYRPEHSREKTGSANSVGKTAQPISISISPHFLEFFPVFVFSRKYEIRSV